MISEYVYFFRRAFAILSAVTFISNYGFARERLLENMKDGSFKDRAFIEGCLKAFS